jgi:hypothetical protein
MAGSCTAPIARVLPRQRGLGSHRLTGPRANTLIDRVIHRAGDATRADHTLVLIASQHCRGSCAPSKGRQPARICGSSPGPAA